MINSNLPKVLIVSRGVWDDSLGISSTLTNLFSNYDSDKVAHIYIETKRPNTQCCNWFFQISEFSLVHKIFRWKTKTGFRINTKSNDTIVVNEKIASKEANVMDFVRNNRSIFFTFLRELLWLLNGWKSKELKSFIEDFRPDVIWLDGSPLVFMNKLHNYVLKLSKKPGVIFLVDDVYSYKYCKGNLLRCFYRLLLRKSVKQVVDACEKVLVISPKMKKEYDAIFGINSIFITKGIDISKIKIQSQAMHDPIKLVYLGQVIYGRIYSLIAIKEALDIINSKGIKMQLLIYTNNSISEELKNKLLVKDSVFLMDPVPYNEVPNIIDESDVLVYVESFVDKHKNTARLSFSTKIADYLGSGKCILAIGPDDIAPIEYLKEENAAIVVTDISDVKRNLEELYHEDLINYYANKGFECARKNHSSDMIDKIIKDTLISVSILGTNQNAGYTKK